ncbi:TPA: efflux transporter periplasmic adaptor subunit, partial [Pseudomonas aeruginosa]|nr:efflux transporter periplasmic adaptor subunit [Pseudomonas aeruginosa]
VKLSTGAAREAVLIDDQAVGTDQGRNYVLVVGENNQAQYRPIELGPVVDGLRVINGSLQAGEKIIIKGLVRPGMAVTPRMVPMQPPAAPAAGADPAKADGAAGSAEARK